MQKNKKYDIVGIGNAIVDLIAEVDDSYLEKNSINKGSMSLVDYDVANRIGNEVDIVKTISGGSVANSIVCIAQQNLKTVFIGKVNQDELGEKFAKGLAEENVEFKITKSLANKHTARCIILVSPDAERTMNTYLGVSQELKEEDVDLNIIEESSILYLEGYLWDLDNAKKAIKKSISTAINSETKIAFSISDAFCVDRFREEFIDLVNNSADIIFANESEIKSLFETNELNDAIKKCQDTKKIFAVTLGDKGAKIIYKNEVIDIKAEVINKLVDTTGAGDLFAAGFLAEYLKTQDLELSGKQGVKMASIIIQQFGARI
ncbi:MAG: adenosine kinase [Pelagibacterales bacterium]|nr:adenosine kinase [Pelagibacterales bacterium]